MDQLSVIEYLHGKGITITGQYFNYDKNLNRSNIILQINLIVELHKVLVGCNFNEISGVRSTIGKEIESYKVQIRRLQKHYDYLFNNSCSNEIETLILSNGKIILSQAVRAVEYIDNHDYYGIIRRSMNREELCIGKVDTNNIRKRNNGIEIGIIKGMTYNLVEEDFYNYIKRLQKRGVHIDEEELLKEFVYGSHLSFNSIDYLRGLLSYPRNFLKAWEKYKNSKREYINCIYKNLNFNNIEDKKIKKSEDEVLLELKKSLMYENKILIR